MMSSRLTYNEDDQWGWIRWAGAIKKAINGKPGQAVLKELEAALIALPTKRLIADDWAKTGDVCALGALDAHRMSENNGTSWDSARLVLQQGDVIADAEYASSRLKMTFTLAWEIINQNDSSPYFRHELTPEQRYDETLHWVRSKINV